MRLVALHCGCSHGGGPIRAATAWFWEEQQGGNVTTCQQHLCRLAAHDRTGPQKAWPTWLATSWSGVADAYLPEYPACAPPCIDPIVSQPVESTANTLRSVRGSSYNEPGLFGFGVRRSRWSPTDPRPNLGFRCAKTVERW
jgi:hypothetical protein